MKTMTFAITACALVLATPAVAATITNTDAQSYLLSITEDGQRREVGLEAGKQISVCPSGCFLTMPNGDREALSGGETVEIVGGKASIK